MWATSKVSSWLTWGCEGDGGKTGVWNQLPPWRTGWVLWCFLLQDFGMSGMRFGTLYTENQHVATAVASLCRYHSLSGLVQYQMAQLLQDYGDCRGLVTQ
jgi:hypothetical protein